MDYKHEITRELREMARAGIITQAAFKKAAAMVAADDPETGAVANFACMSYSECADLVVELVRS